MTRGLYPPPHDPEHDEKFSYRRRIAIVICMVATSWSFIAIVWHLLHRHS